MSDHKVKPTIPTAVILTEQCKQTLLTTNGGLPEDVNPNVLNGAFWAGQRGDEWVISCGELAILLPTADGLVSLDTFTPVERIKIAVNNPQPQIEHDFRVNNNREDDWRLWDIRVSDRLSFTPPWDGIVDSPLLWFALTDEQRVALVNTRASGLERRQYINLACEVMFEAMTKESVIAPVGETTLMSPRYLPPITAKCRLSDIFNDWWSRKYGFRGG